MKGHARAPAIAANRWHHAGLALGWQRFAGDGSRAVEGRVKLADAEPANTF